MKLDLQYPEPIDHIKEDGVVRKHKIELWSKKAMQSRRNEETEDEKWQGNLMANRGNEEGLDKLRLLCLEVGMKDRLPQHTLWQCYANTQFPNWRFGITTRETYISVSYQDLYNILLDY